MRVALLGNAAVLHTHRWAAALVERGLSVRLFSLETTPASLAGERGAEVERLPALPLPMALRYPLAARSAATALARYAPDLVDAHFVQNYGLLATIAGRRPRVVSAWGSDLLLAGGGWRRARARYVLERADRVLVDAENLARAARALGAAPERLAVVPWGVELERFPYAGEPAARAAARAAWPEVWRRDLAADAPVVASTRMLEPVYDLETLVDAWPLVLGERPGAVALVAGEGSRRAALEARARARGVEGRLRFLGRLTPDRLARLLQGADLYVTTSRSDSTSISLLEAMAAGAHPVAGDIEGNREWLEESRAEFFAAGDAAGLAAAILRGLGDETGRRRAAAANRALVERRGDRKRALDRVVEGYRALAGR